MSKYDHPWLQNLAEREAVLCCLNEIPTYDRASTLRAFQTYGFDDATSANDDVTFIHTDTGVFVQHEGAMVSIPFSANSLPDAFGDLFYALNALGWKQAEVHHPAETIGVLLTDMGKAIPANMDFDVKAAAPANAAAHSPEAAALIERGRDLLEGVASGAQEVDDFNALALGELESMDPAHQPSTDVVREVAPSRAAFVVLDDEHPPLPVAPARGAVFLDDDDEPQVPVLSAARHSPEPAPQRVPGSSVAAIEHVMEPDYELDQPPSDWSAAPESAVAAGAPADEARETSKVAVATERDPLSAGPAQVHAESSAPTSVYEGKGIERAAVATRRAMQATVLGLSTVCFDIPGFPASASDVEALAVRIGAAEILHLWPGLVDQATRWDVLGEIDLSAPTFAERMASFLMPNDPTAATCFAAQLVEEVRRGGAQLRDVVMTSMYPNLDTTGFTSLLRDLPECRKAIAGTLGGILLAEEGAGFTDVRLPTDSSDADGSKFRALRIADLATAATPAVWVIHMDETDGPSVRAIVDLFGMVMEWRLTSTRAKAKAEAVLAENVRREALQREEREREAEREANRARIQSQFAEILGQMREMGIELPA
jgi:hypothetical protein